MQDVLHWTHAFRRKCNEEVCGSERNTADASAQNYRETFDARPFVAEGAEIQEVLVSQYHSSADIQDCKG